MKRKSLKLFFIKKIKIPEFSGQDTKNENIQNCYRTCKYLTLIRTFYTYVRTLGWGLKYHIVDSIFDRLSVYCFICCVPGRRTRTYGTGIFSIPYNCTSTGTLVPYRVRYLNCVCKKKSYISYNIKK